MKDKISNAIYSAIKRHNIKCTNCGQEFLSEQYIDVAQAQQAITKLFLESLPEKKDMSGYNPEEIGGKAWQRAVAFNQAIDQITKGWK